MCLGNVCRKMVCFCTNRRLMNRAVAPLSIIAAVRTLRCLPFSITLTWKWELDGFNSGTTHELILSYMLVTFGGDGVVNVSGGAAAAAFACARSKKTAVWRQSVLQGASAALTVAPAGHWYRQQRGSKWMQQSAVPPHPQWWPLPSASAAS